MAEETQAKFRRRPGLQRTASNRQSWVYDFSVAAAKSPWVMVSPDQREHQAAFSGSVWIDQETRRVLKIARRARNLPTDFALSRAESTLDYAPVTIDRVQYLMPSGGESVSCTTGWFLHAKRIR